MSFSAKDLNEDTPDSILDRLCGEVGLLTRYHDITGQLFVLSDSQKISLLEAMGFPLENESEIKRILEEQERLLLDRIIEPVIVAAVGEKNFCDLRITEESAAKSWICRIKLEGGITFEFKIQGLFRFSSENGGSVFRFELPEQFPPGYHDLEIRCEDGTAAKSRLILCPLECQRHERIGLRGIAVQLYALRSDENAGIGDFNDLKSIIEWAGAHRMDAVSINPLHALFPANPSMRSPYSPSNRLFYNPAYLHIESIADYFECDVAQVFRHSREYAAALAQEKSRDQIDYHMVLGGKYKIYEMLFESFYQNHFLKNTERANRFYLFLKEQGLPLQRHCVYETIFEQQIQKTPPLYGWRTWPEELRDPDSPDVEKFENINKKRILYYTWLQWNCEIQLLETNCIARKHQIALYFDIAVGANPDGAEVWSEESVFSLRACAGAPPDDFSATGQNWGISPFIPHRLREAAYEPFVELLRNNMPMHGIVRIDHVMVLFRLFWVPSGESAAQGGYVEYPWKDLLQILALESRRQKCLVVGEDLGTVPDYVRHEMERRNIYSWKVLFFEKNKNGFIDPKYFLERSISSITTHDLPTLSGFLDGRDILDRERLGLIKPEEAAKASADRKEDREKFIRMLINGGYLRDENSHSFFEILAASHRAIGSAGSAIDLASLHDLTADDAAPNMPGTVDEYPCWALRYKMSLEAIVQSDDIRKLLLAFRGKG